MRDGTTRATPPPRWLTATVAIGLGALLVSALGFYWDIGWHSDHGRDEQVLNPPHLAIVVGLTGLLTAAAAGLALVRDRDAPPTAVRIGSRPAPLSVIALATMGLGGALSFPFDDLWHRYYGVDSTLWSPPHLVMLGAGAFGALALWFALVEADVGPERGRTAFLLHLVVAVIALAGATSFLVEFEDGTARWQLLYHPVLVLLIAGVVLTAARSLLGRGGALAVAAGYVAFRVAVNGVVGSLLGYTTPSFALFLAPAITVEAAALFAAPDRRGTRFAAFAAAGLVVIGLPGEWVWNLATGRHVWTAALLPEVVLVGAVAALGGALLGTALGGALRREDEAVPAAGWLALGAVAVVVALAVPYPRTAPDVEVAIALDEADGRAQVVAAVDPPEVVVGARWFEVLAMHGGGLEQARFIPAAGGHHVTETAVPVGGDWKTLVRLHYGDALLAAPVNLPADPELGLDAVEPADRRVTFDPDRVHMMRETHRGPRWLAWLVTAAAAGLLVLWITLLVWVGRRSRRRRASPAVSRSARRP